MASFAPDYSLERDARMARADHLVLLAIVAVGAVFTAQGRSSPLNVGTGAGGSH